jgi:LytR cell envelope-related transcriptional attenuator
VTSSMARRPMPALVALLALLGLTAIVWWRVLHRDGGSSALTPCPSRTSTARTTLPAPGDVTVQVLNATNRTGIAAKARTVLATDGFNLPTQAGNDTKNRGKVTGTAQIRYGPKGKPGAMLLRYYFPGAQLVPGTTTSATVVVSIGAKYQAVATQSAVHDALARDHVALATNSPTAPNSASC